MKANLGFFFGVFFLIGTAWSAQSPKPTTIDERLQLLKEYKVTDARVASLNATDKKVLGHLIAASSLMDDVFLDQVDPKIRSTWIPEITRLASTEPSWNKYSRYFEVSYGPWDVFFSDWILPKDKFPEVTAFPGRNLYPLDLYEGAGQDGGAMAKAAEKKLNDWIAAHPKDEKAFKSPYTVIRRNAANGNLEAIPYSIAFKDKLEAAAVHMEEAAALTKDPALRDLLKTRADAFRNDTYNETEKYWIAAHDSDIQITIGPYEEYMDGVWGLKRGFSARLALKDPEGTAELKRFESHLTTFQKNLEKLPLERMFIGDEKRRDFVTMVNEIYMAGEARQGAQTLAHKLPNDSAVVVEHGSRRVLFRNILEGKCAYILKPIGNEVLVPNLTKFVSCDSFTKQTLHHESAHALGPAFWYPQPRSIVAGWTDEKRREQRKEFSEVLGRFDDQLEEAKADTLGIYNRLYMLHNGLETPRSRDMEEYATYVTGFFRTARFDAGSAHRKGVMLQFNKLRELGAVSFDKEGRVTFDAAKMPKAIEEVVKLILDLQTKGDPIAVEATLQKYGTVPAEMQKLLDRVAAKNIPRDLFPTFPAVAMLELKK